MSKAAKTSGACFGLIALIVALSLLPASSASAARFERVTSTPVAKSPMATTAAGVSLGSLRGRLSKLMKGAGKSSGAWVADVTGAGQPRRLFARRAGKLRRLASNTKLFTTSTALVNFTPTGRLETAAWNAGTLLGGVLTGNLVLRGGGDPTLTPAGLATLATRVRAAGVTSVTGRLVYDESFFDSARGVPVTGVSGGLGNSLSGLTYPGGARKAALDFVDALRARGVTISNQVQAGELPPVGTVKLAGVGSPEMSELIASTNIPSDNFLAETLLKATGGQFGPSGSTSGGLQVVKPFAAGRGAFFRGENGSGLSVRDKASPASVGRLLASMLKETPETTQAWTDSLAVAGVSGTLARRMRGTAAAGRCKGKTGTLNGVSALSGYCFGAGHTVVFSLLMNKISDARAHSIQDNIAATVARFGG